MKLTDVLFVIGIVVAVAGAVSTFFPLIGVGGAVFLVGLLVRWITKPGAEVEGDNEEA